MPAVSPKPFRADAPVRPVHTLRTALLACAALIPASAMAREAAPQNVDPDVIVVTASPTRATETDSRPDAERPVTGPDGAAFIARQPGSALVGNGAVSGQVQHRGLFGERILLRINGQAFATGGPNAMDPAMHYAPMVLIDRVAIARGASPVRDGPGLGGGVNTMLKETPFGSAGAMTPFVDLAAQARSVDEGYAIGGAAGLANDRFRVGVIGAWEQGDDYRFPGGRAATTGYQRAVYGVHAGMRTGPGTLSFEYRRHDTGRSGNPPFAMDIIYFHTDFARVAFTGDITDTVQLSTALHYTAVDHRMNNFAQRPVASTIATRQSDTYADTLSAHASVRVGSDRRHIRVGLDHETIDKGFRLYNPNNAAFFVYPLDRAGSSRTGAFAEARADFAGISAEAGVRIDRHGAHAAAPRFGSALPMGPANLARAFAAKDRDWNGTTVDAVVRIWHDGDTITPRLTLARKTRAPTLIERFAWLPTEASGGLADGNIYVGDVTLRPERSWSAEVGVDVAAKGFYARPSVHYRTVDGYIQGVPFDATPGVVDTLTEMVAQASGDPTPLRFANTKARLWGADVAFGGRLAGPLRFDGVASMVRGTRRDVRDKLYRIAPDNARLALTWDAARWSLSAEGQWVAAQRRVSATNSEAASPSYLLAHAFGHVSLTPSLRLDVGVENVFDRHYRDHLSGYNRIVGSDVPLGTRIPGAGRSFMMRLSWATIPSGGL